MKLIYLNCILNKACAEITTAHKKSDITKYLTWETEDASQSSDAQCSSDRKFRIECLYIKDKSAAQLLSYSDSNLIVISAALVLIWLQKISRYLNSENWSVKWVLHHSYENCKMNRFASKLFRENWSLLKHQTDKSDKKWSVLEQLWAIVIITKQLYQNHVWAVIRDIFQSSTSSQKWTKSHLIITEWDIDWDRVTADEMHTEVSITAVTVHLFTNFNSFCKIRKWFLTDTLIKFSSA